jgi:MoxR-like ATPase
MRKELDNSHFVDGTATSGKGMIDFLFDNPKTEYLLIDEVDKINKKDQTVLYNVMETGILAETKSNRNTGSRQQKRNLKIFATGNELERLQNAFRSRFMEFYLSEYSFEEFSEITKRLLYSKYKLSAEIAAAIAGVVWNDIKTKDIRDVLQIAKLSRNVDDVQDVARTLMKYRPKPKAEEDDE